MAGLRFTRQARLQLSSIVKFIAEDNPATAERVFNRIERRCLQLIEFPQLGRPRPDIDKGMRSLVVERWIVIYREQVRGIQVVQVVDSARDLSKLEWTSDLGAD